MPVERVDYSTDEEYEQALQQEAREDAFVSEPDVVPCFVCGGQMYEISECPEDNICESCNRSENPASEAIADSK